MTVLWTLVTLMHGTVPNLPNAWFSTLTILMHGLLWAPASWIHEEIKTLPSDLWLHECKTRTIKKSMCDLCWRANKLFRSFLYDSRSECCFVDRWNDSTSCAVEWREFLVHRRKLQCRLWNKINKDRKHFWHFRRCCWFWQRKTNYALHIVFNLVTLEEERERKEGGGGARTAARAVSGLNHDTNSPRHSRVTSAYHWTHGSTYRYFSKFQKWNGQIINSLFI